MVAGLILSEKKLLLIHNVKYGLRVEPPGGKKDPEETWEEAVRREVREELGVDIEVTSLFGEYTTQSPEGQFRVRMYWCDIVRGEPTVQEPQHAAWSWYSWEDMEQLQELVPNMKTALPHLKPFLV